MSEQLKNALSWAKLGFRVFPITENQKAPPIIPKFFEKATTDPTQIQSWWADRPYNIGVSTNGMVVLDIDIKGERNGLQDYFAMDGHFKTLVVQTPSGGYHCYFNGPDSHQSPLAPSIDIRSHNGYVLAPGSVTADGEYTLLNKEPVADIPKPIKKRLRKWKSDFLQETAKIFEEERKGQPLLSDSSTIVQARSWLINDAPIAVENRHGDNTTYNVACCLLRDWALSAEDALNLMITEWNPKCRPPWSSAELKKKIDNAAKYGTGALGIRRPDVIFKDVVIVPCLPPELTDVTLPPYNAFFGNAVHTDMFRPRPWLIRPLLMKGTITALASAGAVGKSSVSLMIAAHLAVGKDFGGYRLSSSAPCKSVIYNAEDDMEEQSKRLYALCQEYQLDYETVVSNICFIPYEERIMLATAQRAGPAALNTAEITRLLSFVSDPDIGFLCLDPLIELHNCVEIDNNHMGLLMASLRKVAQKANVSLLLLHHTNKVGANKDVRAGNAEISRGASAITNSARIVLTLIPATDTDLFKFGIPQEDSYRYVRMDDAKMNLSLATKDSTWFEKTSVNLFTGDSIGVLKIRNMHEQQDELVRELASVFADEIKSRPDERISMSEAKKLAKKTFQVYSDLSSTRLGKILEDGFTTGVYTMNGIVYCQRERFSGKETVYFRTREEQADEQWWEK